MPRKLLSVYLAGPMTNCSERQRTVWRKRFKEALKSEFKCLDPTDPSAKKGALAVSADIEEADIVVANMWRESIGTTLGVVQAKRMGIPVILIDQHYLDSPILKSVVGDSIVHSEEAAINKLRKDIAPSLTRDIQVIKRSGTTVPFEIKKLQKSLKSACVAAGIDDPIFHILLSRRVHRAILTTSESSPIKTEAIRDKVLQELRNISQDSLGEGDSNQTEHAEALLEQWEFHEALVKEQRGEIQAKELDYLTQVETLSSTLNDLELEVKNLRAQISQQNHKQESVSVSRIEAEGKKPSLSTAIQSKLGKKRALCIGRVGKTTFASVFERCGISQDEFDELFEEKSLEGKQSNLNLDLKTYVKTYPYILYACDGLRHLADSLRTTENLLVGAGPNDVVRRFLKKVAEP